MPPKDVVYRAAKKEVRRMRARKSFAATTTQSDNDIFVADNKCTLMGFSMVVIATMKGARADAAVSIGWSLYTTSGDYRTQDTNDDNDNEVDKEEILVRREYIAAGDHYRYEISSKAKRKISKGDKLVLSIVAGTTNASYVLNHDIHMYIGE